MSAGWDGQALLEPISAEQPCGAEPGRHAGRCSAPSTRSACSASRARPRRRPTPTSGRARRLAKARPPIEWDRIRSDALEGSEQEQGSSAARLPRARRCSGPTACRRSRRRAHDGVAVARDVLAAGVSAARRGRDRPAQRAELLRGSDGGRRSACGGCRSSRAASTAGSACATSRSRSGQAQPGPTRSQAGRSGRSARRSRRCRLEELTALEQQRHRRAWRR